MIATHQPCGHRRRPVNPSRSPRPFGLDQPTEGVLLAAWRRHGIDVPLGPGRSVALRPIRPNDAPLLAAFYAAQSDESRRRRFLAPVPELPARMVRQLVEIDQERHVAWLALHGERCVGEARYVRLRDEPGTAEIAFSVDDAMRRVGLGRLLVETLAVVGRAAGLETFSSVVGPDNRPSAAMLRSLGTAFQFEDGLLAGRGPLPPWSRHDPSEDLVRLAHDRFADAALAPAA